MSLQYSRGCPFNCEFCDIIMLNGHTPRTKSKEQFLGELDGLYKNGWRASILIVDDNFIGNKRKLKQEILPALLNWMDKKRHPFTYQTEASINIADDDELSRDILRNVLEQMGYTVEAACNGREVMQLLTASSSHLVVTGVVGSEPTRSCQRQFVPLVELTLSTVFPKSPDPMAAEPDGA